MYEHDVERANRVMERAAQDPKIQQVIADARLFDALRNDPGWRRLFDIVAAQKRKWMEELARRLMYGPKPSPEEIAYHRGFIEGAYFVLVHPEVAEANLEKAARIAWRLAGDDDEDTEEVYT
jgi:hypothetical protein